jgi:aminoacyl tRNA synthase complex-interacting multifunctional protein 1
MWPCTVLCTRRWYALLVFINQLYVLNLLLQSQLQAPQYYSHPAVTRYFDHIQSRPSVRSSAEGLASAFSLVSFDLEGAPKLERKPDPPKEKKKPAAADTSAKPAKGKKGGDAAAASMETTPASADVGGSPPVADPGVDEKKAQKKEKKEKGKEEGAAVTEGKKKGAGGGGGKAAPAEDAGEPVPSMIDLRVGHIVESKLPNLHRMHSNTNRRRRSRQASRCRWPVCRGEFTPYSDL